MARKQGKRRGRIVSPGAEISFTYFAMQSYHAEQKVSTTFMGHAGGSLRLKSRSRLPDVTWRRLATIKVAYQQPSQQAAAVPGRRGACFGGKDSTGCFG